MCHCNNKLLISLTFRGYSIKIFARFKANARKYALNAITIAARQDLIKLNDNVNDFNNHYQILNNILLIQLYDPVNDCTHDWYKIMKLLIVLLPYSGIQLTQIN